MASSATTTTWEIRLKETVLGTMNKIRDAFGGTQNRLRGVNAGMEQMRQITNSAGRDVRRTYGQLDDLLQNLQRRQQAAFNTRDVAAYQRMIDRTRADMARLNSVTNAQPQGSRWQRMTGGIREAAGQIPGMGGLMSLASNPATIVAGAAIAIGTATSQMAIQYNEGMAKINATAQLPEQTLGKLKNRLVEIGSKSGGNFELMPDAYEKILSQTGKVNMSLGILETSVKGAKAGFTDIDTVAGALAKTMSIVGADNVTANQVMDTLLKAKAVGAGEFTDFANYMPGLIAAGKNLNISWQDTAGIFAYMTTKTRDAADATMLIKNAYTALSKSDVRKGLKDAGIKLFNEKGEFQRMDVIFKQLEDKLGATNTQSKLNILEKMGLKDAQAKEAFAILMGDAKSLTSAIDGVNNSLGETQRQLDATANTTRSWGDVKDTFKSIGLSIGDHLLPIIDALGRGINAVFNGLEKLKNMAVTGAKVQGTVDFADQQFKEKFGFSAPRDKSTLTKEQREYYKKAGNWAAENIYGMSGGKGKNAITADEKDVSKVDAANTGNSKYSGSASGGESDSTLTGKGGGSGARSLTQNLYITINIKKASDVADGKLQSQLTDIITDSARDGLVTVGA